MTDTSREALIAMMRDYAYEGDTWVLQQEAADMLEADAQTKSKSFAEVHPANPDANCKCEHWQSCAECHPTAHLAQQVAVPMTDSEIESSQGIHGGYKISFRRGVKAAESHHGIGAKP